VATARDRGRCRERLEQLTESSLDCESLQREAIVQLQGVLCRAFALSRRERDVVAALLAGLDTGAVGVGLCISPHTVQDHLKSVFEKTGGHSRPELLARFSGASDPMSRHG
jgi:DNA-binding CsgD family transcriptional regulator